MNQFWAQSEDGRLIEIVHMTSCDQNMIDLDQLKSFSWLTQEIEMLTLHLVSHYQESSWDYGMAFTSSLLARY